MSNSQNDDRVFSNISTQTEQDSKEHYQYSNYGISGQGSKIEHIILTCAYTIVILAGLIGNLLVIRAVKINQSMHTTTNFLIANISTADLITMLSCLPFVILKFYSHPDGMVGKMVCILITKNNLSCITLSVSIISLCILAVERYHALIKPMQHRLRMNKDNVLYVVFAIWLSSVVIALPLLIYTDYDQQLHRCQFTFSSQVYWIAVGTVTFLILVTICYCYFKVLREIYRKRILGTIPGITPQTRINEVRSRRKLVKLLLILTCAFVFFFTPRLVYLFFASMIPNDVRLSFRRLSFFLIVCNSCVNPIICAFQSENYRSAFERMLGFRSRRIEVEPSSFSMRRVERQLTFKSLRFQESQC
ncbi:prolactin-releasing peptide receptor-like [Actinia tenebrosa]|uniref:Prolactin-releasing peptide receptor-like n=1 Tax=Actinia tenebrosa TaxID=6105 RepID=A0A6P8HUN2_ACTTE|nr:prolactin-releasing peptide receptor-like [Actinia tenebrosa]